MATTPAKQSRQPPERTRRGLEIGARRSTSSSTGHRLAGRPAVASGSRVHPADLLIHSTESKGLDRMRRGRGSLTNQMTGETRQQT